MPRMRALSVAAGADALGFIFVEGTPRYVTPEAAAAIIAELPAFVTPVGVFWDHPAGHVKAVAEQCGLGALQFHGEEPPEALGEPRLPTSRPSRWRGPRISRRMDALRALVLPARLAGPMERGRGARPDLVGARPRGGRAAAHHPVRRPHSRQRRGRGALASGPTPSTSTRASRRSPGRRIRTRCGASSRPPSAADLARGMTRARLDPCAIARRRRPLRPLRRPLRPRDADEPAHRARAGLPRGAARPRFRAPPRRAPVELRRPARRRCTSPSG